MKQETRIRRAKEMARDIRVLILDMLANFGSGHLGGSMSAADLLGVLYSGAMRVEPKNPRWEDRDFFVCSKGHIGPAVYSALALRGFFPKEQLNTLNRLGTNLPSHCDRTKTPGIDMTAGSLGQGLSAAAGIAYGNRLAKRDSFCYALIGDGESQEGQIWEAFMFAGHQRLGNLIVFVDNNGEQLDGNIEEVNRIDNYRQRLESFYWQTFEVDGHDAGEILRAIDEAKAETARPSCIALRTIKGKGSFAEGRFNHSVPVPKEDAGRNIAELRKLAF